MLITKKDSTEFFVGKHKIHFTEMDRILFILSTLNNKTIKQVCIEFFAEDKDTIKYLVFEIGTRLYMCEIGYHSPMWMLDKIIRNLPKGVALVDRSQIIGENNVKKEIKKRG